MSLLLIWGWSLVSVPLALLCALLGACILDAKK